MTRGYRAIERFLARLASAKPRTVGRWIVGYLDHKNRSASFGIRELVGLRVLLFIPANDLDALRDEIVAAHRQVANARRQVTAFGDSPEAWALAARAAELELRAHVLEAELDTDAR